MEESEIITYLFYLLPAVVVGVIAFYFFNMHIKNEEQRRQFLIRKKNQETALPLRLQAYERLTLFLERISPGNLLTRVQPISKHSKDYANLLIQHIEQEFEHNLAQQIYVSPECWNVIKASKNATITNLRKTAEKEDLQDANSFRQEILNNLMEQQPPSDTGLAYIKNEVKKII